MTKLRKHFTKTIFTMALLLTVLLFPCMTGQAAANTYKQYSFVRKGSTSELHTKNYSVYQVFGGFKLVKKGKTVKTVKGNLENILYSDKDFYYSTYTGRNETYKYTIYRMTAAGKSTRIASLTCTGLFRMDAVYKNKIYGHYSHTNMASMKSTNYVYCINIKKHKVAKICSFGGILGSMRGGDSSPKFTADKLIFDAGGKAIVIDLETGKKSQIGSIKYGIGDVDTSIWKSDKTTYIEQENAIKKYNEETKEFENDDSLGEYAKKYSVIYADENVILYQNNQMNYLYMRQAQKRISLGKDVFTTGKGISYIDGPVTSGNNVCFIIARDNKSEIWVASISDGKAKKVKTVAKALSFRSDNKKIGYSLMDRNYTIKYVYTVK